MIRTGRLDRLVDGAKGRGGPGDVAGGTWAGRTRCRAPAVSRRWGGRGAPGGTGARFVTRARGVEGGRVTFEVARGPTRHPLGAVVPRDVTSICPGRDALPTPGAVPWVSRGSATACWLAHLVMFHSGNLVKSRFLVTTTPPAVHRRTKNRRCTKKLADVPSHHDTCNDRGVPAPQADEAAAAGRADGRSGRRLVDRTGLLWAGLNGGAVVRGAVQPPVGHRSRPGSSDNRRVNCSAAGVSTRTHVPPPETVGEMGAGAMHPPPEASSQFGL